MIYTTVIQCKESYIVIYFKNNVALNYLSLYAKTEMIINDIECNHKYKYENIPERTGLYFRINIENFSGEKIIINLNYEDSDKSKNHPFNIDVEPSNIYPEEEDIISLLSSDILNKNLSLKASYNKYNGTDNDTVQFSFQTRDNDKYLIIQIEAINYLEYFGLTVIPDIKKEDDRFPVWIIVVISLKAFIVIKAIIAIGAMKGNECCQITLGCCAICCFCCDICSSVRRKR